MRYEMYTDDNHQLTTEIIVLEPPQTSLAGDNNFGCAFCNPIIEIK
ncbi:MAG: hypothetical protein RRY79_06895 [Clostridia bacterium]